MSTGQGGTGNGSVRGRVWGGPGRTSGVTSGHGDGGDGVDPGPMGRSGSGPVG